MALTMRQTKTALGPSRIAYFLATGGTGDVTYSVSPGGAGGTINPSTGLYTAPDQVPTDPRRQFDTIIATDSATEPETISGRIMVGNALMLLCEILQRELGLADGRIFLWKQKVFQPTDTGMYIAVSVANVKPYGSTIRPGAGGWDESEQAVNMMAEIDLNVISRDNSAEMRKEEVLMALESRYSQAQQEANGFSIGRISRGFRNLSEVDGAAIPYRYAITIGMLYAVNKIKADDCFDSFRDVEIEVNP